MVDLLETLLSDHNAGVGGLRHSRAVLDHGQSLELRDGTRSCVFFTVEERIVFLRNLQTKRGVQEKGTHCDECTEEHNCTRSLFLEMHRGVGVGQLVIKVFIDVACCVSEVVLDVVDVHHVIVDEATSVLLLGLEVEPDVVPVGGPDFVVGVQHVLEIIGQRQRKRFGIVEGHFPLEVLVLASVVLLNRP